MKTAHNSSVRKVLHLRGGMVVKNKPLKMGRSVYDEKPIQEPAPIAFGGASHVSRAPSMGGMGAPSIKKIEGHEPVPQKKDLSQLNAVLSGVKLGEGLMKKKKKIRL